MLVHAEIDPATAQRAARVGLTPGALASRCVVRAIRTAARRLAGLFFMPGAYTPGKEQGSPSPASLSFAHGAYTPKATSEPVK